MRELIDIAGRTGQAPVRALLSAAVGSTDPDVLQPHEIRYRNDQHHVIFGLYEDGRLIGMIGLARNPTASLVEILHVALADGEDALTATELLRMGLDRQRYRTAVWQAPGPFEAAASQVGFREQANGNEAREWVLRSGN